MRTDATALQRPRSEIAVSRRDGLRDESGIGAKGEQKGRPRRAK